MKKRLLAAALILAFAGSAASVLHARASSDDNAQIDALYKNFATAFRHKDLAAMMSLYVPGQSLFVFDLGPPRQHVGWDDYRADWKQVFDSTTGTPSFSIGELGVTVSGDVAYTHSIQSFSAVSGKRRLTANARVTDVLRKIGGKWLIVEEHVSVPVDLNTMKPDLLSKP
jgi:ketosteroid isomerase-like protein